MQKHDLKNLRRRYLIWLYKAAKEAFDRIERKFTQLGIDKFLLRELKSMDKNGKAVKAIADFSAYIAKKEKEGKAQKFCGQDLSAEYYFLSLKLKAVEKAIQKELGNPGLKEVKALYEKEMAGRILRSTEH